MTAVMTKSTGVEKITTAQIHIVMVMKVEVKITTETEIRSTGDTALTHETTTRIITTAAVQNDMTTATVIETGTGTGTAGATTGIETEPRTKWNVSTLLEATRHCVSSTRMRRYPLRRAAGCHLSLPKLTIHKTSMAGGERGSATETGIGTARGTGTSTIATETETGTAIVTGGGTITIGGRRTTIIDRRGTNTASPRGGTARTSTGPQVGERNTTTETEIATATAIGTVARTGKDATVTKTETEIGNGTETGTRTGKGDTTLLKRPYRRKAIPLRPSSRKSSHLLLLAMSSMACHLRLKAVTNTTNTTRFMSITIMRML
ncbi:hypothetical protein CVT26_014021, partial [Gymnopilus dilepis]